MAPWLGGVGLGRWTKVSTKASEHVHTADDAGRAQRLQVRSTSEDRPFFGTYLLPIAFADPIEEGIIAPA